MEQANIIVLDQALLLPVVHDHTMRAVRSAGAAAVPDEVLCAWLKPSAIRVVTIVALVLNTASKVVTHGQATGLSPSLMIKILL